MCQVSTSTTLMGRRRRLVRGRLSRQSIRLLHSWIVSLVLHWVWNCGCSSCIVRKHHTHGLIKWWMRMKHSVIQWGHTKLIRGWCLGNLRGWLPWRWRIRTVAIGASVCIILYHARKLEWETHVVLGERCNTWRLSYGLLCCELKGRVKSILIARQLCKWGIICLWWHSMNHCWRGHPLGSKAPAAHHVSCREASRYLIHCILRYHHWHHHHDLPNASMQIFNEWPITSSTHHNHSWLHLPYLEAFALPSPWSYNEPPSSSILRFLFSFRSFVSLHL